MHIVIIMLGKKLGGIEQAFVDYINALKTHVKVTAICGHNAAIKSKIPGDVEVIELFNLGSWDFIAAFRLKNILNKLNPDAIISHANRAVILVDKAKLNIPHIGVIHNYNLKYITKCDAIFSITNDLKQKLVATGYNASKIHIIPNMIDCTNYQLIKYQQANLPIIGSFGRFVEKKGFSVLIQSLSLLRNRGYRFQALIGGDGEERSKLQRLVKKFGLEAYVNFIGWVQDKNKFFKQIDIFCIPSLHEPFGIVVLEGMLNSKPIVTTLSEGPREILENKQDSLLVEIGNASLMADALEKLIREPDYASKLVENAFLKVKNQYDTVAVSEKILISIKKVIQDAT